MLQAFIWVMHFSTGAWWGCWWSLEGDPPLPMQSSVLTQGSQSRGQARVGSAPLLFPVPCIQGYAQECLYCVHKLFQFFSTRREKVIFPTLVMGK